MQCHTMRHGRPIRKRPYSTKKKARSALAKVAADRGWDKNEFNVYRCTECGDYHFGRKSRQHDGHASHGLQGVAA